jgi:hypothetical protein
VCRKACSARVRRKSQFRGRTHFWAGVYGVWVWPYCPVLRLCRRVLSQVKTDWLGRLTGHSVFSTENANITLFNKSQINVSALPHNFPSQRALLNLKKGFCICILSYTPLDSLSCINVESKDGTKFLTNMFIIPFNVECRLQECYAVSILYEPTLRRNTARWTWNHPIQFRMPSPGMLRHVGLVRIDVSEEHSTSIVRTTRIFAACAGW